MFTEIRPRDHRLRGSGSTVVTMTSEVNRKTEISTPCRTETPNNIEIKIGLNDYVVALIQWCPIFVGIGPKEFGPQIGEI